jgi:Nucleotide-sugar transporter
MKFADNILKTFASSMSIVLSCLYSYWIMDDLNIEINFVVGTIVIIAATSVYGFLSFQKDLLPSVVESTRKIIPYQRITQYKIV